MGFLGTIFGSSDSSELKAVNKSLIKRVQQLESQLTELQEKDADDYHEMVRENYLEQRRVNESQQDFEYRMQRDAKKAENRNADAIEEAKRLARNENKIVREKLEAEIAALKSDIRDLNLAAEEAQTDSDLAVQEGILEYRESHVEDIFKLEVKLAVSQGETKTAQAESKSKDAIIAVLTKMVEDRGGDVTEALELVSEIAPNVDLSNLSFNVTAAASPKQGGDQKKEGNK